MEEQGALTSLCFVIPEQEGQCALQPFLSARRQSRRHLTPIKTCSSLIYDASGPAAGGGAAFLLHSAKRAGSLYAAARCLHLHTSPQQANPTIQ